MDNTGRFFPPQDLFKKLFKLCEVLSLKSGANLTSWKDITDYVRYIYAHFTICTLFIAIQLPICYYMYLIKHDTFTCVLLYVPYLSRYIYVDFTICTVFITIYLCIFYYMHLIYHRYIYVYFTICTLFSQYIYIYFTICDLFMPYVGADETKVAKTLSSVFRAGLIKTLINSFRTKLWGGGGQGRSVCCPRGDDT